MANKSEARRIHGNQSPRVDDAAATPGGAGTDATAPVPTSTGDALDAFINPHATLPSALSSSLSSESGVSGVDGSLHALPHRHARSTTPASVDAHHKSAQIYGKTRQMMCEHTNGVAVYASRGFGRAGYLPTRTTSPCLRSRRYSIDVLTKQPRLRLRLRKVDDVEAPVTTVAYREKDLAPRHEAPLALPNPLRYRDLKKLSAVRPPLNDSTYLVKGDSMITNWDFLHMVDYSSYEAWMRDDSLNMSLELLALSTECSNHGIAIVNTNSSQILLVGAQMRDTHEASYDMYRESLRDKKWILIPINDGMGSRPDGGSHWSLVIVDRVHKLNFYYDSLGTGMRNSIQGLAWDTTRGLLMLLEENLSEWQWRPQFHSPDQRTHNSFQADRGACGPFVWKMASLMIARIKARRCANEEANCDLSLSNGFPNWFRSQFHSLKVRHEMQALVASYKASEDAEKPIHKHDEAAMQQVPIDIKEIPPSTKSPPLFKRLKRPSTFDRDISPDTLAAYASDQNSGLFPIPQDRTHAMRDTGLADPSTGRRTRPRR